MKRNTIIGGLVAAVLLLIGMYVASPWIAVSQLRGAAKAGDRDKLDRLVDFPAVRESLKSQLKAQMLLKTQSDPDLKNNPFAGLAVLVLPALVDRLVDAAGRTRTARPAKG